jgi:3'-phosphoadenosine 5'-phosphosulfate sulfotransferase (PAPS reductase)/FAD synthetase and related enzymes
VAKPEVMPSVASLIAEGALFVVNHSGGKDSQAMLIRILEQIPARQVLVVHASLGEAEWDGALEHAQEQAAAARVPFLVAKSVKTFFEMVERRYAVRPGPNSSCWPSSANRQCTSDLKRDPIQREVRRYMAAHGLTLAVTCLGIRAAESPGRARRATMSINSRGCTASRRWYEWLPIHDLTTDQVLKAIADAGQRPHWAYAAGNTRLSCVFCIMGSPRDLANGAKHRPELLEKYLEIERRTGYTMHQSRKSLGELIALGQRTLEATA